MIGYASLAALYGLTRQTVARGVSIPRGRVVNGLPRLLVCSFCFLAQRPFLNDSVEFMLCYASLAALFGLARHIVARAVSVPRGRLVNGLLRLPVWSFCFLAQRPFLNDTVEFMLCYASLAALFGLTRQTVVRAVSAPPSKHARGCQAILRIVIIVIAWLLSVRLSIIKETSRLLFVRLIIESSIAAAKPAAKRVMLRLRSVF